MKKDYKEKTHCFDWSSLEKKQIVLTGSLSLPLRIGERAFILCQNQALSTTIVKQILEVSECGVIFETCNTIYRLRYATFPVATEVMCA